VSVFVELDRNLNVIHGHLLDHLFLHHR
jgi:hypothetical protein